MIPNRPSQAATYPPLRSRITLRRPHRAPSLISGLISKFLLFSPNPTQKKKRIILPIASPRQKRAFPTNFNPGQFLFRLKSHKKENPKLYRPWHICLKLFFTTSKTPNQYLYNIFTSNLCLYDAFIPNSLKMSRVNMSRCISLGFWVSRKIKFLSKYITMGIV